MHPAFWKLSHGTNFFGHHEMLDSVARQLVYVHKDTRAKGQNPQSQADDFINAPAGDYFYLTNGNAGIYLLGQFSGPANLFSLRGNGWLDRPFRLIRPSQIRDNYAGPVKWWTPNENSTFIRVPDDEVAQFEKLILRPFFGISLSEYGVCSASHE